MQDIMPSVDTVDNLFHDGNPVTGAEGTIVSAEYLNNHQSATQDTQEEMKSILTAAGINIDPAKQDQLLTALSALYLSRTNPGADIAADGAAAIATFLTNLGLGEAKYVTSRGSNANGTWIIWSDGAIEVMGYSPSITNGLATVTYPIELPQISRHISIAERLASDTGATANQSHVSMIIDQLTTTSGFQARCTMSASGNASTNGFSWRVYCAPV